MLLSSLRFPSGGCARTAPALEDGFPPSNTRCVWKLPPDPVVDPPPTPVDGPRLDEPKQPPVARTKPRSPRRTRLYRRLPSTPRRLVSGEPGLPTLLPGSRRRRDEGGARDSRQINQHVLEHGLDERQPRRRNENWHGLSGEVRPLTRRIPSPAPPDASFFLFQRAAHLDLRRPAADLQRLRFHPARRRPSPVLPSASQGQPRQQVDREPQALRERDCRLPQRPQLRRTQRRGRDREAPPPAHRNPVRLLLQVHRRRFRPHHQLHRRQVRGQRRAGPPSLPVPLRPEHHQEPPPVDRKSAELAQHASHAQLARRQHPGSLVPSFSWASRGRR